jgi:hypothetical protein
LDRQKREGKSEKKCSKCIKSEKSLNVFKREGRPTCPGYTVNIGN